MDGGYDCGYQIKETRIPRTIFVVVDAVVEAGKQTLAEWNKLRSMMMRVLAPFPEAEQAVIRGIKEIMGTGS